MSKVITEIALQSKENGRISSDDADILLLAFLKAGFQTGYVRLISNEAQVVFGNNEGPSPKIAKQVFNAVAPEFKETISAAMTQVEQRTIELAL